MRDWKKHKLGDLVEYKKGYAFKSKDYQEKGIRVIRVSDLTENSVDASQCVSIDETIAKELSQFKLAEKDIVITTVGSWEYNPASVVGKVIKVPRNCEGSLLNQNAVRLRAKLLADQLFIYYRMKCDDFHDFIITGAQGSANQAAITLDQIFAFECHLPTLDVQKQIASILSSLDDKIELNRRMNQTLEQIAATLFKKYFVDDIDPENLPEGWRWGKLDDITVRITKGTTPTTLKKQFVQSGINFLKVETLTDFGTFDFSKLNFIDDETDSLLSRSRVQEDDILFSIAGTLGRMAKANSSILPANTNQALAIIRPDKNITHPLFIYHYLKLPSVKESIFSNTVQGVQANLSLGVLSETQILIPVKDGIEKIFNLIEPFHRKIERNENELSLLIKIRDTLLPKLMSGEIDLPTVNLTESLHAEVLS